jgi:hypothetical protein
VSDARTSRLAELLGAVALQLLEDRGAARIALLDDGGPEAALAARLLAPALGPERLLRVSAGAAEVESLLHLAPGVSADRLAGEVARLRARLAEDAVAAFPANKTALLLGGELPPEPFLPLGDLWASQVEELAGAWSGPQAAREAAEALGGVARLDAALAAWSEGRDPRALDGLPEAALRALRSGRASRLHPRIVPKLGYRTLGVDLFE